MTLPISEQLDLALNEMSARKVLRKLRKAGCKILRQRGSHVQVSCGPGRQSTVPKHGGKDIKTGTLKAIEKSLEFDLDGDGRPSTKPVSEAKSVRLNKTEKEILKEIDRHGDAEIVVGLTKAAGDLTQTREFGHRRRKAMDSLVKKGIIRIVDVYSSHETDARRRTTRTSHYVVEKA